MGLNRENGFEKKIEQWKIQLIFGSDLQSEETNHTSGDEGREEEKKIEIRGLNYFESLLSQFVHNFFPRISSFVARNFILNSPKGPKSRDGQNQDTLFLQCLVKRSDTSDVIVEVFKDIHRNN